MLDNVDKMKVGGPKAALLGGGNRVSDSYGVNPVTVTYH